MAVYKKVPGHETVNISTLEFDETPTPGSLNPVTSGGVAESVSQQSSNIAPNYTKKTYEANSYVMQDGVLYTNPNAIGTAEDWNPAHWTQTTVAETMAGDSGYKQVNLTFATSDTKTIPVGQKEEVHAICSFKNTDDVIIQFAEDCTDAVVILTRANNTAPHTFKTMRGSTTLPLYGANLITNALPYTIDSSGAFLKTTNATEEHGASTYEPPTDFNEMELNDESLVHDITNITIKHELLNYREYRANYLIVAKGSIVMCLPGD